VPAVAIDRLQYDVDVYRWCTHEYQRVPCRSAPLPLKVDGFSMGAVMGYSEQHTCMLLCSEEEVQNFCKVRAQGARWRIECRGEEEQQEGLGWSSKQGLTAGQGRGGGLGCRVGRTDTQE
jgi:hypothetical protein